MRSDAWSTTPLGEQANISLSGVDKRIVPGEQEVGLCNYLDVYRNRRISSSMQFAKGSAKEAEIRQFQLMKGDVLITKDSETPDDIGIPAVVVDELPGIICGYHLALIRPSRTLSPSFLGQYLQSEQAKRHFLRHAAGATRFGLNFKVISSIRIPNLDIDEQAAIARVLDAVDAAIANVRAAIDAAKNLNRALIQDFFYSALGITAYADRPSRELPAGWALVPMETLLSSEPKNGVSPKASAQPPGIPTFSIAAIRDGRIDLANPDNLKYADIPLKVADKYRISVGDILIVRGNANPDLVGKAGRVDNFPEGCIYPDITKRVVFRREGDVTMLPEFAVLAWNHLIVHNQVLRRAKTSNGTLKINNRDVKQIVMPVPPAAKQQEIVMLTEAAESKIDALCAKLTALGQLKKSLMHDLLTGSVRVNDRILPRP